MGFFKRVGDIISANISDLLDKMEEPEKMMKQLVREMEEAVVEAKGELVKAIAHERRVEKEIASQKNKVEEWQRRAGDAVKKDREDLARRALELKLESRDILAALDPELAGARQASAAMKTQLRALQAKCQEAKRKQVSLAGRSKAAEMQMAAGGASPSRKVSTSAFAEFDRLEEQIAQKEAQAEAVAEVGKAEQATVDEFEEWESGEAVDAELAALKESLEGKSE